MARPGVDRVRSLRLDREWALLLLAAAVAGAFFFSSLGRVWPLLDVDLNVARPRLERLARAALEGRGFDVSKHAAATELLVAESHLEYIERKFGAERAQPWARDGLPFVTYHVLFREAGDVDWFDVFLTPEGRIVAWWRNVEEDEPAAPATMEEARVAAAAELERG